jgi:hypothetical protein
MLRIDRTHHRVAGLLPGLALVAGTLVAAALAAPRPALAAGEIAVPAESGPVVTARALLERYSAEGLSESVLLRPRAEGSAVRSIEIDDDGSVLVNGKDFDEEELVSFLGEDGGRLAALAGLDARARRVALGLEVAPEQAEAAGPEVDVEIPAMPGIPPVPRVPSVPHIRVRASRDDRVSVGHSIHIGPDETANDVVCVGCSVDLEGEAFGNVVAVGGSVRVKGTAHGDAVSIGGSVDVSSEGEVQGEGVAIGGSIDVDEGGQILGQRSSVGIGGPWFGRFGEGWDFPFGMFSDLGRLVASIFRTGLLALVGVLLFLAMRPAVERAARRAREEPWKAVFAGLLVQLLVLPVLVLVTVILAVSIIGIPLLALVPVAILAFVVAALLGFVGVGLELGRWVERRTHGRFSSPVMAVIVGIVLIQATSLVGRLLSIPSGWVAAIGFSIVLLGFFLKYVAWTVGMGAMTLVAFARDWRRRAPEPSDAEPAGKEPMEPAREPPPPPDATS